MSGFNSICGRSIVSRAEPLPFRLLIHRLFDCLVVHRLNDRDRFVVFERDAEPLPIQLLPHLNNRPPLLVHLQWPLQSSSNRLLALVIIHLFDYPALSPIDLLHCHALRFVRLCRTVALIIFPIPVSPTPRVLFPRAIKRPLPPTQPPPTPQPTHIHPRPRQPSQNIPRQLLLHLARDIFVQPLLLPSRQPALRLLPFIAAASLLRVPRFGRRGGDDLERVCVRGDGGGAAGGGGGGVGAGEASEGAALADARRWVGHCVCGWCAGALDGVAMSCYCGEAVKREPVVLRELNNVIPRWPPQNTPKIRKLKCSYLNNDLIINSKNQNVSIFTYFKFYFKASKL